MVRNSSKGKNEAMSMTVNSKKELSMKNSQDGEQGDSGDYLSEQVASPNRLFYWCWLFLIKPIIILLTILFISFGILFLYSLFVDLFISIWDLYFSYFPKQEPLFKPTFDNTETPFSIFATICTVFLGLIALNEYLKIVSKRRKFGAFLSRSVIIRQQIAITLDAIVNRNQKVGTNADNETYQIFSDTYYDTQGVITSIESLVSYYYSRDSKLSILISLESEIDSLRTAKDELNNKLEDAKSSIGGIREKYQNNRADNNLGAMNTNEEELENACKEVFDSIRNSLGKINKAIDEMKSKILDESHIIRL